MGPVLLLAPRTQQPGVCVAWFGTSLLKRSESALRDRPGTARRVPIGQGHRWVEVRIELRGGNAFLPSYEVTSALFGPERRGARLWRALHV